MKYIYSGNVLGMSACLIYTGVLPDVVRYLLQFESALFCDVW